jgi:hypothetical protein
VPVDVRSDLGGAFQRQSVRSAREDDQLAPGKQLGKAPADGDRAYRVRVSPQQQHRNADLPDALGEILPLVQEPAREVGIAFPVRENINVS